MAWYQGMVEETGEMILQKTWFQSTNVEMKEGHSERHRRFKDYKLHMAGTAGNVA